MTVMTKSASAPAEKAEKVVTVETLFDLLRGAVDAGYGEAPVTVERCRFTEMRLRVELLMTGGHLRRQSQSFYGDQAEQSLQNYHFDMLFLGVDAIDLERGVSTHNEDEARLNRRMCEVAERIIVVTDSSKFNRSSLHKIIDTQRIDMIIVDEGIPADSLEGLRKAGVEVILVGE